MLYLGRRSIVQTQQKLSSHVLPIRHRTPLDHLRSSVSTQTPDASLSKIIGTANISTLWIIRIDIAISEQASENNPGSSESCGGHWVAQACEHHGCHCLGHILQPASLLEPPILNQRLTRIYSQVSVGSLSTVELIGVLALLNLYGCGVVVWIWHFCGFAVATHDNALRK